MDLRQLRYLVALAEEGSFTRAAASEHIAQPAVSQQIRRLEDELGLALVERTTRRVRLTDAGELLVVRARRIMATARGRSQLDGLGERLREAEDQVLAGLAETEDRQAFRALLQRLALHAATALDSATLDSCAEPVGGC